MVRFGCCLPGGSFMPQGEAEIPPSTESVLLEGAQIIVEAGYSYSEVSAGFLNQLTEEEVVSLARAHRDGKLPLEVCNCLIPGEFSIFDDEKKGGLQRYIEKILRRAARIGIDTVVFGSGAARRIPHGMNRAEGVSCIREFLRTCNSYCERYGITLAIEPLNKQECNVLNTVAEGAEMVRSLQLPKIRLLADAYHMYCEEEDLSILKKEQDLLVHIHVSEQPGRGYPGRDGGGYLTRFARALRGYCGRVSIECSFSDFQAEIHPACTFLKGAFS